MGSLHQILYKFFKNFWRIENHIRELIHFSNFMKVFMTLSSEINKKFKLLYQDFLFIIQNNMIIFIKYLT